MRNHHGETMTLTFGSLFAGIGGIDLGFHQAGLSCAWQVEINAACRSVLARHWLDVPKFEDVRRCGADTLIPVDVICGGFPCQDLSIAGNRAGLAGMRSGLFYEMTRIADELRPAFLVWENVPGLLSSDSGRDFGRVLMELERIGYSGCWSTLDAQFFGLAQRRQRVFGVFARSDIGTARCTEILSLTSRLPWNTEKGRAARQGVASSVTASAGHHGRSSPRGDGSDNLITEDPYTFDWMAGSSGDTSFHGKARSWIVDKPGRSRALTANRTLAVVEPVGERVRNALTNHHGRNSGEDTFVCGALSAAHGGPDDNAGQAGHIVPTHTVVGALMANAATERKHGDGGISALDQYFAGHIQPSAFGVRRLTPLECERLQGFPDNWTAGQSDSTRYRQIGNAVAVPVAAWIGRRICSIQETIDEPNRDSIPTSAPH